nr:Uncharacterised protein [Klebsiella pneumoniae]
MVGYFLALSFVRAVRIACLKTFRSGIVVHVEPAPDKYFCGEIKPGSRFTHRQAVTDNRPDDHEFKFIGIMIIFCSQAFCTVELPCPDPATDRCSFNTKRSAVLCSPSLPDK